MLNALYMIESNKDKIKESTEVDEEYLVSLRPKRLDQYVGQQKTRNNLSICIEAAKKRKEPIEHLILYGPPGLGKTTLAHIVANEMNSNIRVTSGPAIERAGDLASILTNLEEGDILFIDEIHRLNRNIEEVLYPAMEDFAIDLVLGKGPSARTMRLDVPRFTLVGATTKMGTLSSPLRDRFGVALRLDYYDHDELKEIIKRAAKIQKIELDEKSLLEIARRSRRTPRVANRLLKRVRDYAEVKHKGKITEKIAREALKNLEIDSLGLDKNDREYLETIAIKFGQGPVGLNTLSAALSEDRDTIEDVIEPYLLQLGFIDRTNRGRIITDRGMIHLGVKKIDSQSKLI